MWWKSNILTALLHIVRIYLNSQPCKISYEFLTKFYEIRLVFIRTSFELDFFTQNFSLTSAQLWINSGCVYTTLAARLWVTLLVCWHNELWDVDDYWGNEICWTTGDIPSILLRSPPSTNQIKLLPHTLTHIRPEWNTDSETGDGPPGQSIFRSDQRKCAFIWGKCVCSKYCRYKALHLNPTTEWCSTETL